jgi:AcrR family transcriptional regulator
MTKKEQIFQVAMALFAEKGYSGSSTSLIAQRAGVSEGLIFRHYQNKAGLLQAIIAEGMAQIAQTMSAYGTATEPRQAILQHIEHSLEAIQQHAQFWRLASKIRFQDAVQAQAAAQIAEVNQFIVRHLSDNFQKLGAPEPLAEALLLFAQIDAVCLHWLQDPEGYPLQAVQRTLIKKYQYANFGMD